MDKNKQKTFLRYKYNGYLDKSDHVDSKDKIEHNIDKIVENRLRNEKWLDWFLKRHKELLSNVNYTHAENNNREIINEYFTEHEQKIISCGLSNLYMFEKFRGCLAEAPNLSLDQFQELCFLWWVSLNDKYPILASKGQISEAEKREMYKLVAEERLKEAKEKVKDNLYFLLEQYLRENELPTPKWYFDYQREKDIAKRAELFKKTDIHAKKYRENRIIKTKEFYEKHKDKYPELKGLIEREVKEEEKVIKNLEETIKEFDYLEWSKSYKTLW